MYQDFASKSFCPTVPRNFVGEPLCAVFQKVSGSGKAYGQEGGEYQDFLSKSFCLTLPKVFVSEPISVSLISGIEKVFASYGYVTFFRRCFFFSQNRKTLRGNPSVLCFVNFLVAKKFMDKRGSIKILRRKIFVSQFRKNS